VPSWLAPLFLGNGEPRRGSATMPRSAVPRKTVHAMDVAAEEELPGGVLVVSVMDRPAGGA
jgi:hypothetical protein